MRYARSDSSHSVGRNASSSGPTRSMHALRTTHGRMTPSTSYSRSQLRGAGPTVLSIRRQSTVSSQVRTGSSTG